MIPGHDEATGGREALAGADVAELVSRLATVLLTSATPHSGIERALLELCDFLGMDRATAFIVHRDWPHDLDDFVSVTNDGERRAAAPVLVEARALMVTVDDDDGLLIYPEGELIAEARRQMRETGAASVRACRVPLGDDTFAVLGLMSLHPYEWSESDLQVLRLASRIIGHSQARSLLERKVREQRDALAASEGRLQAMIDGAPASIFRVDRESRILLANREVGRFNGVEPESLHGIRLSDLISEPEAHAAFERALTRAFELGEADDVRVSVSTGIGEVYFDARSVPELDDAGNVVSMMVYAVDVTDQRRLEDRITLAATTDPLTGLANRLVFVERLAAEIETHATSGRSLAVLFIDVDRFKRTNDGLGHAIGDELLRTLGRRLRQNVRSTDLVARFGGDEFAVAYLDVADRHEVERLVDQLRHEIARPVEIDGMSVHATVSIGAAIGTPGAVSASDLLRGADHAMYQAKRGGRNRCEIFDDAMRHMLHSRRDTESALRTAIESASPFASSVGAAAEGGVIAVHYLPEVDLETGAVVAVEALARWHHPTRGLLPASEFMDLAEDTGLITDLGAVVLREACMQAASWVHEHPDLVMRVNVSSRQLAMPRFVGDVAEALVRAGLDSSRLTVEIAETALVGDVEGMLDALVRIRDLGVSVAIDDFGTGHSALSYLEQLPVEIVKIDRRYVSGIGGDGRDAVIVATLVRLGLALGLTVVAEGVETIEQRNELWELGCRRAQGYLFSRPRPANELTPYLGRSFALR